MCVYICVRLICLFVVRARVCGTCVRAYVRVYMYKNLVHTKALTLCTFYTLKIKTD